MKKFTPYIEGIIGKTTLPIFIRIVTQHFRIIKLAPEEYTASNHLDLAVSKAMLHYSHYITEEISGGMPIVRYCYYVAPDTAWRIELDGSVTEIARSVEQNPRFRRYDSVLRNGFKGG